MDLILVLQILPLALGAAISPTVLMVQILVLASGPKGLARAWALAIGLTAALLVLGFVGFRLMSLLPDVNLGRPSVEMWVVALIAGVVLLLVAWREYRTPQKPEVNDSTASRFADMSPWLLVPVGFFWQFTEINTLALYLPALHLITSSAAPDITQLIAVVVLVAITSVTWIVPPLAVALRGDAARRRLEALHRWLRTHDHDITIWTCLVFGVGLLIWAAAVAVAVAVA